jgi:putative addiction module component (TIGR02574 family)
MTTQTADIMEIADSLPIDMKLELVDRLLESITPSRKEIDEAWSEEVERRIDEVESGKVQLIPGEEVFARMRERYNK